MVASSARSSRDACSAASTSAAVASSRWASRRRYPETSRSTRSPRASAIDRPASETRKVCQASSLVRTRAWWSGVRGALSARFRVRLRRPMQFQSREARFGPRARTRVYVASTVQVCVRSGGLTLLVIGARSARGSDAGLVCGRSRAARNPETRWTCGGRGASLALLDDRERQRGRRPRAASPHQPRPQPATSALRLRLRSRNTGGEAEFDDLYRYPRPAPAFQPDAGSGAARRIGRGVRARLPTARGRAPSESVSFGLGGVLGTLRRRTVRARYPADHRRDQHQPRTARR